MRISFNVSEDQLRSIFAYAEMKGLSISETISEMLERMEDEIDSKLGDEALDKFERSGKKAIPHKEFWKGLDI